MPLDKPGSRTTIARPDASSDATPAQDDRAHYFVVVEGREAGRRIELGETQVVIGREPPADVILADALVSRRHCRVQVVMGEVVVTDAGSSNGTWMSGGQLTGPRLLTPGDRIRVGSFVLELEWRSRREVEALREVDDDLAKAALYVRALLPEPVRTGRVRTDWVLQPSARLGGDAFGYHFVDESTFAIYLLDVTGHGTEAAMHAVSVINVLRQRAIPGMDARDPGRVAKYLNEMFPMDRHGNMLQSLWYGVCDLDTRTLAFTSAGHHAGYLIGADRGTAVPLDVSNVLIGMMPRYEYRSGRVEVAPGSSLYLFSDGAFEIEAADGKPWGIDGLVRVLLEPPRLGHPESGRILDAVKARTGREAFDDDFTLVVATFA